MTTIYRNEETLTALICVYDKILRNDLRRNENLAMDLLRNPSQLTSPIAIDKFFGIEIAHGISLSFAARSTTFLLEVISDELSSGYLAISSEGDIGIILKNTTNNISSVILVSKNKEVCDFYHALKIHCVFDMQTYDECDFQKPPAISLEEINSIFHARTGYKSILNLFYIPYKVYRNAKNYKIEKYNSTKANEYINEYILTTINQRFNFYENGHLDEDRIKYGHLIKLILKHIVEVDKDIIGAEISSAVLDCISTPSMTREKNIISYSKLNISNGNISSNTMRIMEIAEFDISRTNPSKMAAAQILRFQNGDCFVYNDNRLVGKYSKDEPMDKLDGILNDEYAFQLLEWRYVGQTTIIEPTPQ